MESRKSTLGAALARWCVTLMLLTSGGLSFAQSPPPSLDSYPSSAELSPGSLRFFWRLSDSDASIHMAVQARTPGWVALGISEVGAMVGSDVMLGWVENGMAMMTDRFIFNRSSDGVALDQSQDVRIVAGSQATDPSTGDTWTTLHFWRALNTSDCNDRAISPGEHVSLIWAMGQDDSVAYHGSTRGSTTLQLVPGALFSVLGPQPTPPTSVAAEVAYDAAKLPPPSRKGLREVRPRMLAQSAGVRVSVEGDVINATVASYTVPTNYTTYACNAFEVSLAAKRHAAEFGGIINSTLAASVHHMIIFACLPREEPTSTPHFECLVQTQCSVLFTLWGPGTLPIKLPAAAGLPVGPGGFTRFVLQVHYTNPDLLGDIVDSSGMYMKLSPSLREHEAGFLAVGPVDQNHLISIPPRQAAWTQDSYCPSECTARLANTSLGLGTNITIVGSALHQHLLGRQVYTDLYRNGQKLVTINRQDYFDFGYQQMKNLDPGLYLMPGDELRTRCVWDSSSKSEVTPGGQASNAEMCVNFLMYYPARTDFSGPCFNFCQAESNTSSTLRPFAVCGSPPDGVGPPSVVPLTSVTCPAPSDFFGTNATELVVISGCPASLAPSLSSLSMDAISVPATSMPSAWKGAVIGLTTNRIGAIFCLMVLSIVA